MKALPGHWRVRNESREEKHVQLWFDSTESDYKGDPKRESKSSFSPEEPKSKILRGYCMGQFYPMFKLCGRRPGPILSSFIQMKQGRARPNIRCEGKRIFEDSQPKNGQNYRPRRGGAYLWGTGPCPRTMATSGLLSEVSGELVNHSEQRLGRTLYQSKRGKYQIKGNSKKWQISKGAVTSTLNASQLTFWPH